MSRGSDAAQGGGGLVDGDAVSTVEGASTAASVVGTVSGAVVGAAVGASPSGGADVGTVAGAAGSVVAAGAAPDGSGPAVGAAGAVGSAALPAGDVATWAGPEWPLVLLDDLQDLLLELGQLRLDLAEGHLGDVGAVLGDPLPTAPTCPAWRRR